MTDLVPVTRPNGRLYRPRKIDGHAVADDDDFVTAVLILGTHDIERAWPLADLCVRRWVDNCCTAVDPYLGWWRNGYLWGERTWLEDETRGRAGVRFEAVEV